MWKSFMLSTVHPASKIAICMTPISKSSAAVKHVCFLQDRMVGMVSSSIKTWWESMAIPAAHHQLRLDDAGTVPCELTFVPAPAHSKPSRHGSGEGKTTRGM